MREIKFRAWDELNNKMIYPHTRSFSDILSSGDILNRWENIMQFTGLLDKNGKESFEGDFIHGKIARMSEVININGKIEYSTELAKFIVKYKSPRGWDLHMDLSVFHEIEIIGNIYENPELLTNN